MRRRWVRETAGWVLATAVALVTVAVVSSSSRGDLIFRDGDSLIVAMLANAQLAGSPTDWALSSVLFLPETGLFTVLSAVTRLDVGSLLALSAVLNLIALYGAIRLAAGRARPRAAPVAWSLIALAVFCAVAATETSGWRDDLELASMMLTTTYYSATVIGVVLCLGIVRRAKDSERMTALAPTLLALVAVPSALTNPLFVVWGALPTLVLLGFGAVRPPQRVRSLVLAAALLAGVIVGLVARIPFSAWIANTGVGYAQPDQWIESLGYYGGLLARRASTPGGVASILAVIALLVLAVVLTRRASEAGSRFIAAAAWLLPVTTTIGAIALGTHAARYLQPVVFAGVLALVSVAPVMRLSLTARRTLVAAVGVVGVIAAGFAIPRIADAAHEPDPDLACVTDWTAESGRIGAGQFWTVRLPKLHLDDPSHLVQVDHRLNAYAWLVGRSDFAIDGVSFLVEDAQTTPWELPQGLDDPSIIECGRYRILDFGDQSLSLGPERS